MVIISFSKVAFQLKLSQVVFAKFWKLSGLREPDSNLLKTVKKIASEERYHLIVVQGIYFTKTTIK